jgi:hypothetical protein
MPRFRNTDNGRIIDVLETEAFIYERASNFEPVKDDKSEAVPLTVPARETSFDAPVERTEKRPKTTKRKT